MWRELGPPVPELCRTWSADRCATGLRAGGALFGIMVVGGKEEWREGEIGVAFHVGGLAEEGRLDVRGT